MCFSLALTEPLKRLPAAFSCTFYTYRPFQTWKILLELNRPGEFFSKTSFKPCQTGLWVYPSLSSFDEPSKLTSWVPSSLWKEHKSNPHLELSLSLFQAFKTQSGLHRGVLHRWVFGWPSWAPGEGPRPSHRATRDRIPAEALAGRQRGSGPGSGRDGWGDRWSVQGAGGLSEWRGVLGWGILWDWRGCCGGHFMSQNNYIFWKELTCRKNHTARK